MNPHLTLFTLQKHNHIICGNQEVDDDDFDEFASMISSQKASNHRRHSNVSSAPTSPSGSDHHYHHHQAEEEEEEEEARGIEAHELLNNEDELQQSPTPLSPQASPAKKRVTQFFYF
jgi:hypothetical protein